MIIKTSHLIGSVKLPPSKSILHRLLIAAALSSEKSEISGVKLSDDITATINGLTAMGTDFFLNDDIMTVTALCKSDFAKIDCIESGSTLRFLMPICAALGINCEFSGIGRLPERPLNDYLRLFSEHNIKIDGIKLPIKLSGKLTPGRFELPGNISSQFVTGLLFALPLLEEDSEIVLTSPLESKGYANMTIFVLKKFSIEIMQTETGYKIKGNQKYSSCNLYAEGDWSAATFFMLAGALGGKIKLLNLSNASCQSDMACFEVFKAFGAATDKHENYISCKKGDLHGIKIDASEIPDMVPCIAAAAAMADGITEIFGASRLRFKESNRITAVVNGLISMGFSATELPDGMIINGFGGKYPLKKTAVVNSMNDHRIAMAFSILASFMPFETEILGYNCVSKSYPDFYNVFKELGGKCYVNHRK